MNDVFGLKSLDTNLAVVQDKEAGSRWPWVLLCNCSELTCIGYLGFSRCSGDVSCLAVKSGRRC